jgi:predicted SAM-dependent methyltransferase
MKINLGCYDKKLPGFTNIDIRPEANPDIVDDAFELKTISNNSVELIYSSHMLEHLNYEDAKSALKLWYSKLIDGGILRLAVPDFEAICKRYIYTGNINELLHSICGSQKHDFDYHYNVFDETRLRNLLLEAGFKSVSKYNWWERTPHNYCDDFSQSYIPATERTIALSHGRVIHGQAILMSLNLEAIK